MRSILIALLVVIASVSLACGGDDDGATETPGPTAIGSPTNIGGSSQAYIIYRDAVGSIVAQDLASGESISHAVDFNTQVVVSAACSPDGSQIAFLRQHFDRRERTLEIRDESGIREFEIPATTQGFDWSPDGQRIVYAEFDGFANTHKVSIIDLATGETSELTSGEAIAGSPAWSADGSTIAFDIQDILSTHSDIYLIDPDGGEPEQVPISIDGQWRDPAWTPDGGLLVAGFVDGAQQLFLLDPAGGEPQLLTDSRDIFKGSPKYAPDGSQIAYTGSILVQEVSVVPRKLHSFGIFLVNTDGTNERAMTADPRLNPGAAVDPYLDAYLLGWCLDGPWLDDSWVPFAGEPTPQ